MLISGCIRYFSPKSLSSGQPHLLCVKLSLPALVFELHLFLGRTASYPAKGLVLIFSGATFLVSMHLGSQDIDPLSEDVNHFVYGSI